MNATPFPLMFSNRITSPIAVPANSWTFTSPTTTVGIVELKMNSTVLIPEIGSVAKPTLAQPAGQVFVTVSTKGG